MTKYLHRVLASEVQVIEALRALSAAYAAGVDRRDAALVRACFTPDAELVVRGRDGVRPLPERRLVGRDEISGITTTIARYRRTFHLVGQGRYDVEIEGRRATGEVYCEAHHHAVADDGTVTDRVLHIRYQDTYALADEWLVASRIVAVDWAVDVPLGRLGDEGDHA
jgi:hypothetical protein